MGWLKTGRAMDMVGLDFGFSMSQANTGPLYPLRVQEVRQIGESGRKWDSCPQPLCELGHIAIIFRILWP